MEADSARKLAEELTPMAAGARLALVEAVAKGHIELCEHEGYFGSWAEAPAGQFFVALGPAAKRQETPYDRSYVPDSENEDDWIDVWAEGHVEHVQVNVDSVSGRIRNWFDICSALKFEDCAEEAQAVELAEAACKRHLDKSRPGKGKAHAGGKYVVDCLDHKEWELKKWTEGRFNRNAIQHKKTGEAAPSGSLLTRTSAERGTHEGWRQQGQYAQKHYSEEAISDRWDKKIEEVMSIGANIEQLRAKVQKDLKGKTMGRAKACALLVLLINRHLFRIGTKVGVSGKFERGATGVKRTDVPTYGATLLTREHVKVEPGEHAVYFEFLGKAAKEWTAINTDERVVAMVKTLLSQSDEGERVFWYREGSGRKYLTDDDVREYVREFGFTPHRFRTYYASLTVFQELKAALASGAAEDERSRKKAVTAALKVAGDKLNDTPGAAKNYVIPQIIEDFVSKGRLSRKHDLKPINLSEADTEWWMEHELDFLNYVWDLVESEEGLVEMAETLVLLSGPWPALRPGDRWVTLKPHGPDSDDYKRVIIREHKDGSAHVVWAGHKGLLNLRLQRAGEKREIEEKERKKASRVLTPEERQAEGKKREERETALQKVDDDFGKKAAKLLGLGEEHAESVLQAFVKRGKDVKGERSEEERELDRQRREERMQRILEGDSDTLRELGSPGGEAVSVDRALAEAAMQDITGEIPNAIHGVPEEVSNAWNAMRKDKDKLREMAGLRALRNEAMADVKKELKGEKSSIRVMNRMAFYDDPGEPEMALLRQAQEKLTYELHSKFWEENGELGDGARRFFVQGAVDALTSLSHRYSLGRAVAPGMVHLIGPEAVAAAVAADIMERGDGIKKVAAEKVMADIAERSLPTVTEALERSDEAKVERESVRKEHAADRLTDLAAKNALIDTTTVRQKHLARAAGSLEAAASVADFLRAKTNDGVTIKAGHKIDEVQRHLQSIGMVEGEHYHMHSADGAPAIHIPQEHLSKLLKASEGKQKWDEKIAAIKDHKENTPDFHVPGMAEQVTTPDGSVIKNPKMKDSQQAAIRFAEHVDTAFGNVGTGIGKTLMYGAKAARHAEQAAASGEDPRSWYILPTNLIPTVAKELQMWFPEMDINVAHTEFNRKLRNKAGRREAYRSKATLTLIGQDSIREDAETFEDIMDKGEGPGQILGDEVHAMFTPNENEDPEQQSARSRTMLKIRAPKMFAGTGTPIRRSSAESWKVFNWLRPGEYGTLQNWNLKYGKIGQGTTAFADTLNRQFQEEINDIAITEKEEPSVKHKENIEFVPMSDAQISAYGSEEDAHHERIQDPKVDKRKSAAQKINRQRNVIYAGKPEQNAMLQRTVHKVEQRFAENGNTPGLIHCTSLAAVRSIAAAFKPGEILTYTGEDDMRRRDKMVTATNTGQPVIGGRARSSDGVEGVVEKLDGKSAVLNLDDGGTVTRPATEITSTVKAIAGTSNAQGVISTGLNMQGLNWYAEYQLPDSAATRGQRIARELRTGQKRDVTGDTIIPDTPAHRKQWRQLKEQEKLLQAFDDPTTYDDTGILHKPEEIGKEEDVKLSEGPHEYSCVMAMLPEEAAGKVRELQSKISTDDLIELETEPHLTVRWGLHGEKPEKAWKCLHGMGSMWVGLEETKIFSSAEHDVVYVEATSPSAEWMHAELGRLPNTKTHAKYVPHVTVAYVKPGKGKKYAKDKSIQGTVCEIKSVVFRPPDGERVTIPLERPQE